MSTGGAGAPREYHLFVYDGWMSGLSGSERLASARLLGPATTEPRFDLVDLGAEVALVTGGASSVTGEVYAVDAKLLASLDVEKGHPLRYKRVRIRLDDGRQVDAHTLDADQVRGRRRIRPGDYRAHVAPAAPAGRTGPWAAWARGRRSR